MFISRDYADSHNVPQFWIVKLLFLKLKSGSCRRYVQVLFIMAVSHLSGWRPLLEFGWTRIFSEGPASSQLGLGLVVAKKLFLITPFLFISLASVSFQGTFVEHARFLRLNLLQNGLPYQEDDHYPSRTDFIHPSFVFRISYLLQIFPSFSTFGF